MSQAVIGVIGGMGSYATSHFFRKLLDAFPAEKEWERPHIIIDNNCVMPSRVRAILYDENVCELVGALSRSIDGLAGLGCNYIILACITSHYFLPHLNITSCKSFEIIDLLKATASTAQEHEIYICCTEGTAEIRLWDQYFCSKDTRLIYPNMEELQRLRYFIEAVKQNKVTHEIVIEYTCYFKELIHKNIVLGCTELSVLYDLIPEASGISGKNFYDPLRCGIHELKRIMKV